MGVINGVITDKNKHELEGVYVALLNMVRIVL